MSSNGQQEILLEAPTHSAADDLLDSWQRALGQALSIERARWEQERELTRAQHETSIANLKAEFATRTMELMERFGNKLADIKDGDNGPQGIQGERGEKGEQGISGERGEPGLVGLRGEPGQQGIGIAGPIGERGERGETGERGNDGQLGPQGEVGPQGGQGEKGETGEKGEAGEKGEKGEEGNQGPQGQIGIRGEQGQRGEEGQEGRQGQEGPQGQKGDIGERGLAGEKGDRGIPGDLGQQGLPGMRGEAGERGLPGPQGLHGEKGEPGDRGLIGPMGPMGDKGERGLDGKDGARGEVKAAFAFMLGGVHYKSDIVTHKGSTYQATCDTAREPPHRDWVLLAGAGLDATMPEIVGTYESEKHYNKFNIVALNGGSFIARCDNPGLCPGEGWQLIASAGRQGKPGMKGDQGEKGPRGDVGPILNNCLIDPATYTLTIVLSDGTKLPKMNLRSIFEQYHMESREW